MEFVPQSITSYTSSQLTPEYANWSNATTYIVGDKVIYGNYIWICSFAGSLNFEPNDNSPHWTKWGVSNYWSLIDLRSQTLTKLTTDLTVEFSKVGIETLIIGYFKGSSILVEVLNDIITTESQIFSLTSHTDGYVYAGTYPNGKILRSNNGTTWTEVLDTTESCILSLTSHTDGYVYAGTYPNGKILRSNNGTTWTEVLDTTESRICTLTSHTDGYVYAGTATGGKIFRSNNGTTWTEVLDTTESYIFSLTSHTDGYVYAGTYPNGKIFRSNNGTTWTEVLPSTITKLLYTDSFSNPRRDGLPSYLNWIHANFIDYSSRSKVFYLPIFGSKARVTFKKGSYLSTEIGFMVGGRSTQMGKTLEGVKLGKTSYTIKNTDDFGITTITSRAKRKYHDFETSVDSELAMNTLRIIENYDDTVMAFIIDNNINSKYENIVTLGVYESVEPLATNNDKTVLSWTVVEMI